MFRFFSSPSKAALLIHFKGKGGPVAAFSLSATTAERPSLWLILEHKA
jgi:hypothetical protein